MTDSEAMFARKLGLAVGMWDWWRIRELHTPQEWAVQLAANEVDPIGEDRADYRAAINTAQAIASSAVDPMSQEQLTEIVQTLRGYLPVNRQEAATVGPAAMRQALGE